MSHIRPNSAFKARLQDVELPRTLGPRTRVPRCLAYLGLGVVAGVFLAASFWTGIAP